MENTLLSIIISAIIGLSLGYGGHSFFMRKKNNSVYQRNQSMLKKAEEEKEEMLLEAKKEMHNLQEEFRKEEREMRKKISQQEKRILEKEQNIESRLQKLDKEREDLDNEVEKVEERKKALESMEAKQEEVLESIAKLSKTEAQTMLLEKIEEDMQDDILTHIKKAQEEAENEVQEKAKKLLAEAMQRSASDVVSETTVTIVELPSDEMKGRIIGKEGRNIHAFERETGVDVIVDDTPGVVIISGYDLIRRYIAKIALERLMTDGRIHPTSIKQAVEKAKKDVVKHIREIGEKVIYEIGISGFHPDLIKLLGRLKFRTSFGQNLLKHSVEVCYIAMHLAEEMGADVDICKRGALLHMIGKATNHEVEGHHSEIGSEIAKKYGVQDTVREIILSADNFTKPDSLEAIIVNIANKIAETRPGAKKEGIESFVKRLQSLEEIAKNFDGVEEAYAIHSGRAVRIIVNPEKINDVKAYKLAKSIARTIEQDMKHAGQIKITILRETHVIEYAK